MPDRWTPTPERTPFKCVFTQQDQEADGPYFEARLFYFDAVSDPDNGGFHPGRRPQQLYLSPQAIIEACELTGSPVVAMHRDRMDDLLDRLNQADEETADLAAQLSEARAELEILRKGPPVDVQALANALIVPLGDHFAKKAGRKPKVTA